MAKGKFVTYGEALAAYVEHLESTKPEEERVAFRAAFLGEVSTYSLMYRRQGAPRNEGCVYEFDGIDSFDFDDPVFVAKFVKQTLHNFYQKDNSGRSFRTMLALLGHSEE